MAHTFNPGAWEAEGTPLIPALGRQRQASLCEFKVSLVYRVPGQAPMLQRNSVLKSKNKTKQNKKKEKNI